MIDYRLLGPIEAGVNGHALEIGGQKQRALLTILLLSANEAVSREVLIDRLWGECPPARAQHTLEVYISRLRKTLKSAADEAVVLTRSGAYLLRVPSERIDIAPIRASRRGGSWRFGGWRTRPGGRFSR